MRRRGANVGSPSLAGSLAIDHINLSEITGSVFWERYVSPSKPVVIRGAFENNVGLWSLESISEGLRGREYTVRIYAEYGIRPKREWKDLCETKDYSIDDYVTLLMDGTAHRENMYMAQIPFGKTPLGGSIRSQVSQLEHRCDLRPCTDINLWLGPSGHTEPLHFDLAHGTLMQLHGAKRIVLFSPSQTANLYPFTFSAALPSHFSQVDTERPDLTAFPRYADALARRVEVELTVGEVLFIPATWWHEVSTLGTDYVCSVNRWWYPSYG
jgi:ribosomal protein L16 Arg81 hydroxylase